MFVGEAIHEEKSLSNNEAIESFQEDVHVIQSSLTFVDELIKSMLDMHKAENNELHVQEKSTKLATDVFETVRTVVDSKHNPFEFLVDCPPDLTVKTDALKLKQIVMNLATNSRKFVSKGYIKVGAYVKEAKVIVFIEDTGPGIPKEKRALLFSKYQESLDSLTPQGTGLGLSLCKSLVGLMGGEIYLDSSFYSSIADCPAARIIIDLNRPPIEAAHNEGKCTKMEDSLTESIRDIVLPENLSILVVDDDMILRRMIVKAMKRVAPSWVVEQCSNGETALKLVEARQYDLIFVDQYMAGATRQLLGTETVHAMRAQGITSCLCGLSANPHEEGFLSVGANAFIPKPFPCEKVALTRELYRVIQTHPGLAERAQRRSIS